jgi:inorganic pyrophosphatase
MKKFLIFFFIFFLSTSIFQQLFSKNKNLNESLGCTNDLTKDFFLLGDNLPIKKIEIDTHKYRDWVVNNIKIITSNTRFVPNILKKKFNSTIKVTYDSGDYCILTGRVRHSGDAKDHIALKGNSIIQSLDVSLNYGNIKGITKFKLFKPDVRGVLDDVLIQTQLLRDFGYLAPRSYKVEARVNQMNSVMLFQEKAAKELLEFNKRREGPILEGDQKYFFKLVKDIPDNNLSNWSVGTPFLRNKSIQAMLAKSTNSRIINKGNVHKEIFLKSLNDLNLIYLYWANRFQDDKNNFFFFDYDLDNELLSFFDQDNNIKLDVYNLFLQSTNSQHALSVSNRKFFWNSIENFFEPINYDSNPAIERANPTTTTVNYRFPVSKYVKKSFIQLEQKLDSVDVEKLYENLLIGGIDLSRQEIKNKLEKISSNLKIIKETYSTKIEKEKIEHNSFKSLNNIKGKFISAIKEIDPNTNLIRYDKKKNIFEKCKAHSGECANIEITNDNLSILLEGELIIENTNYQYLGTTLSIEDLQNKKNNFSSTIIDGSKIFYESGVEVNISDLSKVIEINQKEAGARTYVMGGTLSDYQIYFNGFNIMENDNSQNLKLFPPNFPIDSKNLTGCLSFINLDLKNINIKAKNSSCEDTVNFINVSGNINSIEIENSFSDALDVDFSNLDFKNIKIINALNDCVDFSAGRYNLGNLNLSKCGDKGLSIGEKSSVFLKRLLVNNANLGVATKDGSYLDLKFANMSNLKICVSAYNKKQEFTGGFIEIEKLNCEKYFKKADSDNLSKIFLEKKLIENNIYGEFYNPSDLKISKVEGKTIKKHLIKDFRAFNKDGSVNAAVEINSGIKEKWEISRTSGYLSREFYMGSPRSIQHTPYPVNYGMIPRTILPVNRGGDGDPLDIIILGESLPQGKVVKVKPLGVIKMTDSGEKDDKIIAVPINSPLVKFNNLDHFKNEKPEVLNNIKEWFINYKGKNIVEFINFESDEEANFIIKDAARNYKRSGLKERS